MSGRRAAGQEGGAMLLAAEWGVGQVLWSILWFTLFFIWIWLLIMVFVDIFRSHDLGGFAKALWVIFVIVLPYLGVFVYLIARGHKMQEHAMKDAQRQEAAQRAYIQSVSAPGPSAAEQIAKADELRKAGTITDAEFEALKTKALAGGA
jgi:type VI protein secretion system component VasK